jgi:hypothetical protein
MAEEGPRPVLLEARGEVACAISLAAADKERLGLPVPRGEAARASSITE